MEKPAEKEKKETQSKYRRLMIKELERDLRAPCLFVTQYRGLSVKDLEELRQKLRPISGRYLVAKNSLSRIVLAAVGFEGLAPIVSGQTGFAIGQEDPIALSKVLVGYAKGHEALKLCGGVVDGELLTVDRIREFASLPPRQILLGKVVFLIKSPLSGLGGVLAGTVRKFLYALQEISKQKEKERKEG
ncbi:MAG: 50S ribosomal protein L10 [Candidatus Omnitrophica bacterium]|nr:50S ribosomal protein L10 [Candidatus Omnitrophota bacterium]